MITFNFYKLFSEENIISSVSLICNKILDINEKAIIYFENKEMLSEFDGKLWVFASGEFLPHLTIYDEEFVQSPIVLSDTLQNKTDAENFIIFSPVADFESLKTFKKIFYLFDAQNEEILLQARNFWKVVSLLQKGFTSTFYEQSQDKKWQKKL